MRNLTKLYVPICDYWVIYDNSTAEGVKKIAYGSKNEIKEIVDPLAYNKILEYE
jgi:predicted ABC-type ATPase